MSVTISESENSWLIRVGGQATLGDAAELKSLLVGCLSSGKKLEIDLERVEEIDITILQLLAAAGREAARDGRVIVGRASAAVMAAVRDAGFDQAPGFPISV